MRRHSVFNRSQAPNDYPEPILRAARILYDLRDKLVRIDNSLGPGDTLTAAYNGYDA